MEAETKEETKCLAIEFGLKDHEKLKEAAKAERMQLAPFCRRIVMLYVEGRLVEKPLEPCECPKG